MSPTADLFASFSDGFWPFAIPIAIAAMGDAAWHPMATGVLAQIHKGRRAYALGVHAIGGHLAEFVALPGAGLLLAMWDWRVAIQVLIIPTLVVGVLFVVIRNKVPRHVNSRPTLADLADIWGIWTDRAGLRVIGIFITYNMGMFATITMTPLFLSRNHDFSWLETALAMAFMMLFGALAQPGTGKLSDRVGRWPLIIAGNGLAAVAAFVAWMSSSILLTLFALGVALTVLVAIRSVLLAAAVDHAGGREGTSLGLAFACMDGFAASAAVLAGWVGKNDLSNAFLLAAGFSLAAALLATSAPKRMPSVVEKTTA